jgi:hypothetical protein
MIGFCGQRLLVFVASHSDYQQCCGPLRLWGADGCYRSWCASTLSRLQPCACIHSAFIACVIGRRRSEGPTIAVCLLPGERPVWSLKVLTMSCSVPYEECSSSLNSVPWALIKDHDLAVSVIESYDHVVSSYEMSKVRLDSNKHMYARSCGSRPVLAVANSSSRSISSACYQSALLAVRL